MDKASPDIAINIGKKVKAARQKRDTIQAEVAKEAGLSTNYYARIERGDAAATMDALQKIAHGLKVNHPIYYLSES